MVAMFFDVCDAGQGKRVMFSMSGIHGFARSTHEWTIGWKDVRYLSAQEPPLQVSIYDDTNKLLGRITVGALSARSIVHRLCRWFPDVRVVPWPRSKLKAGEHLLPSVSSQGTEATRETWSAPSSQSQGVKADVARTQVDPTVIESERRAAEDEEQEEQEEEAVEELSTAPGARIGLGLPLDRDVGNGSSQESAASLPAPVRARKRNRFRIGVSSQTSLLFSINLANQGSPFFAL